MTMNNNRYDLSDRLIHFFRSVDPSDPDTPVLPEHWGFGSMEIWDDPFSPFFMMRNAIRIGRLWATWAVRGGRRTIYGPDPTVCFTEMPMAAFIEAGLNRSELGQAMSPYGLVFPKTGMFELGARPAIYSLSGPGRPDVTGDDDGERRISTSQLPLTEQYRYVTYDPSSAKAVDWSHEREWRWPLRQKPNIDPHDLPPDMDDLWGLELDSSGIRGLGAIVRTSKQEEQIVYDILTKVDRKDVDEDCYEFVLALDRMPPLSELRDRTALQEAIDAARIDLARYQIIEPARASELSGAFAEQVREIERKAPPPTEGAIGGCWLWLLDNQHEMTRALVADGRVCVNKDGRYLVHLCEFSDLRNIWERGEMAEELASCLQERYGLGGTYFSVLLTDDPDAVPFYCGDQLDDESFFNYSNGDQDY